MTVANVAGSTLVSSVCASHNSEKTAAWQSAWAEREVKGQVSDRDQCGQLHASALTFNLEVHADSAALFYRGGMQSFYHMVVLTYNCSNSSSKETEAHKQPH